jgi:hypothetical protein
MQSLVSWFLEYLLYALHTSDTLFGENILYSPKLPRLNCKSDILLPQTTDP